MARSSTASRHDPTESIHNEITPVKVQVRGLGVELRPEGLSWNLASYIRKPSSNSSQPAHHKQLLHSISADILPASLTAVIGVSGSGKTTFLDALSNRLTGRARIHQGIALFNGRPGLSHVQHAYLAQKDVFIPTITVRETLLYAASLRLPPPIGSRERRTIVENIIDELGLSKCADTRVGNSRNRGCSGGEKRRLSIGIQLLANPSLLFLDEPTTGLDAANALSVVTTLRKLARRGRVIIMTIHSPRSEIWPELDNLIVLAEGHPIFSGPIPNSLSWLEANGYVKPNFANPAELIVDITALDYRDSHLASNDSRSRVEGLKLAWSSESDRRFPPLRTQGASLPQLDLPSPRQTHTSQSRQLRVLTDRTFKTTYRDPLGMTASITGALFMGLAIGYMFFDLDRDEAGIRSRQGCMYATASLQGYVVLIFETYRLTLDMPVYDREASERCVSPVSFLLSRRLARFPTEDFPVPLILSSLIYFMSGINSGIEKYFVFFSITIINHFLAVLCATACVSVSRDFAIASLMASLIYTLQSLASGMIIHVDKIPRYLGWTRWITYTVR